MINFISTVLFLAAWGFATWYFLWDARSKPGTALWSIPKGLVVALIVSWLGGMILRWVFPILFAMVGTALAITIVAVGILTVLGLWGGAFSRIRARG